MKIKYINQFVPMDDGDALCFLMFAKRDNQTVVAYKSLPEGIPYGADDYDHFAGKYGSSFKLELVYG